MHVIGDPSYTTLELNSCHLSNFYQYSERNSCGFLWLNNVKARIWNCNIDSFSGINNSLLYQDIDSITVIENSTFNNITSNTPSIMINDNVIGSKQTIVIRNCKFTNFMTNMVNFIYSLGGTISFSDSSLENFEAFNHKKDIEFCERFPYTCSIIGASQNRGEINFVNTIFRNITGYAGFTVEQYGKVSMENCLIQNNKLENGFIYITNNKRCYGNYNITNSVFDNNTSNKGTIIHISKNLYLLYTIDIYNTIFTNNYAKENGGIIYSSSKYYNKLITINDCQFYNNYAGQSGNFSFIIL
ncbi:hypothetical protein BCR36DRAFT_341031 [Piromyces finnis]|uniref:Right handed beta helix domain-containing protein n=1 Tax=Piromyces finnis TaxID=1754191 RepID=A0A1Y1VP84_9FUNG|nr:hypothetical protein BCR36DRAFT_341031 [Piromyces finnis]|eukprot:ORX60962.1 hypothetical protein BCR36DRAFT_341031 [Piromyces finnis]